MSPMSVRHIECTACGTKIEGSYEIPRLSRMSAEDQKFIELLVIHEGSLKAVGSSLEISYPTIKKRLAEVIAKLRAEAAADAKSAKRK
jgi:hypothetical protein